MFTEDVFAFYGGKRRFGEAVQVQTGRIFIVLITLFAYAVALRAPETIFELAIQYAFSGFAALSPLVGRRIVLEGKYEVGRAGSHSLGRVAVVAVAVLQEVVPAPAPGPATVLWAPGGVEVLSRTPGGTAVFGFMPVVPMVIVSALLMIVVSTDDKETRSQLRSQNILEVENHEETWFWHWSRSPAFVFMLQRQTRPSDVQSRRDLQMEYFRRRSSRAIWFSLPARLDSIRRQGSFRKVVFEAQFQQVFKNLTAVLEASGSSVDHIVKATVFLADMNDYNAMNELYRKQFKGDPPARTTVQVARLPRDARIEIEAVAVLK